MRAIDDDPLKYAPLKDRVYERVTTEYSWDRVADEHDMFFRTLFGNESESLSTSTEATTRI